MTGYSQRRAWKFSVSKFVKCFMKVPLVETRFERSSESGQLKLEEHSVTEVDRLISFSWY